MFVRKENKSFIKPYSFVSGIYKRLGLPVTSKKIKQALVSAKILLEKLHGAGYDDNDIVQMTDYVCQGMTKKAAPRDFRYFYSVLNLFLEQSAGREAYNNVQEIQQVIQIIGPEDQQ